MKDDIVEEMDIVKFIGKYVDLKKRGQNHIGLCPFHKEKTPSFTVNPEKKIYHCFGCGEGGNVVSFYAKLKNMSIDDAAMCLYERLVTPGGKLLDFLETI